MESVWDATLQSLHRSAHWQALALHLKENYHLILHKDLYYHPHKIQVAQELSEWHKASWLQFSDEFLDLVSNNSNTTHYWCLVGLTSTPGHTCLCQQTYLSAAGSKHPTWNSPRPLHSAIFLWHYWSPFLSECGEIPVNLNAQPYKVTLQTVLWNESHHQLNLLWFQQDGTTAHTAHFYASARDNASRQTHFLFQGHHLAYPLIWSCSTTLLPLWLCQKKGTCPASTNDIKQKIQECKVFMGPLSATTCNNLSITTALV